MATYTIAYDCKRMRPGCVLIQAAMGATIPAAFYRIYYMEQSCAIQLDAQSMDGGIREIPQEVLDKISQLVEVMGADRFVFQGDYGGQPWPKVMGSLERFSGEVLPELKKTELERTARRT